MKLYGAIDLHSNNNVLSILDKKDRVIYERRLPNNLEAILKQLSPYKKQLIGIAVESTYNWYWLVDGLQAAGYRVHLVNTAAVKVYEGLKYLSDEQDARHLAHLLRLNILPTGYIYPKEERAVRDLLRKRSQLVRQRTVQVLSVQNLWSRNTGTSLSADKVKHGYALMADLGKNRTLAIASSQTVLNCLSEEIVKLERIILKQVKARPEWDQLLTVNGIGKILGLTILLETGDIGRFKKVGQFASYCRCVNSRRLSNFKKKGEGNRKNGNRYLAWAFIEAANFAIRSNDRIKSYYQRKKAKTKRVVALKAVAHKLARASYFILRDGVTFELERAFG